MLKAIITASAMSILLAGVAPAAAAADGKSEFVGLKCNKCHTVSAQGVEVLPPDEGKEAKKPVDLSKVGGTHDKSWIKGYIEQTVLKQETAKDGTVKEKKHKKKFKGTGAQLDAIVAWLSGLK